MIKKYQDWSFPVKLIHLKDGPEHVTSDVITGFIGIFRVFQTLYPLDYQMPARISLEQAILLHLKTK